MARAILYARVSTKKQAEEDRFSLPQQLAALREYAANEGYEVPEGHEITDAGYSGVTLERPGMDRVRDLVAAGGVSVVLAQDRDRFAREPAYLYILKEEFAQHGCTLRAMNARGDESPEGELTDGVLDQLAKYERAKFMERSRRGKLQKAKQGRVPGLRAPMGFIYADDTFKVDESRMAYVRRMFRMIGVERETMAAVTRAFERDGVPTQGGAKRWQATTIRRMLDNDAYFARPYEEVAALVPPEVAARLDREKSYGIYWFNRRRIRKVHTGSKRNLSDDNDPSEWIAVPVPDAGIPREWVESARAAVKDNARHPDAGHRFWELKGLLFCPCGRRMTTHMPRRKYKSKTYFNYYYICNHERRYKSGACEHARYHKAEQVEGRIRRLILDLVRRPEVMMEHVREDVEREKKRLKHARRERAAWADELSKIERRRDAYVEMRADGDITKEGFREKVAELDARRTTAERELRALDVSSERVKLLDSLPDLVGEHIRELPSLVHGREGTVRDYTYTEEHEERKRRAREEGRLPIFPVSPDMFRERTSEEMEQLQRAEERERAERYRAVYELLGLKVVAHKDGTLDVSGSFGVREMKLGAEPSATWRAVTGENAEVVPPPDNPSRQEEDRCPNLRVPRRTRSPRSSSRSR